MKKGFSKAWRAMVPWPKTPGKGRLSVCHFCDTLHRAQPITEGFAARCVRCGSLLYQNRPASLARATAFSLAALLFMSLAHYFPFLTMNAASMQRDLSLFGAATALINEGAIFMGSCILIFTIIVPTSLMIGLIYLCFPLLFGRSAPGANHVAKWIYRFEPWNMVEVFLLGVLVSLLKLAKVAEVHFELGFWSFAAVMFCMAAAVAGIDKEELWDRIEVSKQ